MSGIIPNSAVIDVTVSDEKGVIFAAFTQLTMFTAVVPASKGAVWVYPEHVLSPDSNSQTPDSTWMPVIICSLLLKRMAFGWADSWRRYQALYYSCSTKQSFFRFFFFSFKQTSERPEIQPCLVALELGIDLKRINTWFGTKY
jgi:hypothetical protein